MGTVRHVSEVQILIDTLEALIDERRAKADDLRHQFEQDRAAGELLRAAYYNGSAAALDDFADHVRDVLAQFKRRR